MINNRLIASALCFIAFLLFYGLTSRSDVQLTDEVAVFASAISLESQGNLAIDELKWQNDEIIIGKFGNNKHLYTKYFPGNIAVTAMAYNLAKKKRISRIFGVSQWI